MPESEEYWYSLGEVYAKMGDFHQAVAAYEQALEVDETYFEARFDLASLFWRAGEEKKANQLVAGGISLHREEPDFLYHLAAYYYKHNFMAEALVRLQQALTLDFENHVQFFEQAPDALDDLRVMDLVHKAKE